VGITKLSKSGFKSSSYEKYNDFLAGNTAFSPSSYESIATVTVGSGGAANVEFTSIPSTYTHLQIRGIARLTGSYTYEEYVVRVNSDSNTNYSYHYLQGSGSSAVASAGASTNAGKSPSCLGGASLTASVFGAIIFDILDYKDTNKYTTIRMLGGVDNNGGGYVGIASSLWRNTNAITSFELTGPSNFAQYSTFALYGIKGA
jgi:hypothetical protein